MEQAYGAWVGFLAGAFVSAFLPLWFTVPLVVVCVVADCVAHRALAERVRRAVAWVKAVHGQSQGLEDEEPFFEDSVLHPNRDPKIPLF